ncbi:MAG: undecaprenyl-diphosphate phosphatase [Ruminococcaceae bacterium]|nr:undecaprenyl-diphosphate phosphatase [Oscillospiraceae bacterium]
MNLIEAIILALIQSVTEFLPVSSSGLVYGLSALFKIDCVTVDLLSAVLHIGSLFSVVLYFRRTFYDLLLEIKEIVKDVMNGRFSADDGSFSTNRRMLFSLIISTCVSVIVVLILNSVFPSDTEMLLLICGICFLVTGFIIFLSTSLKKPLTNSYSTKFSLVAGLFQGLSIALPGFSRFATTVSAGNIFGISKQNAIRYSFVLSFPAMVVSCVVSIVKVSSTNVLVPVIPLLIGFLITVFCGFFFINLISKLLKNKLFNAFGFINTLIGIVFMLVGVVANFNS